MAGLTARFENLSGSVKDMENLARQVDNLGRAVKGAEPGLKALANASNGLARLAKLDLNNLSSNLQKSSTYVREFSIEMQKINSEPIKKVASDVNKLKNTMSKFTTAEFTRSIGLFSTNMQNASGILNTFASRFTALTNGINNFRVMINQLNRLPKALNQLNEVNVEKVQQVFTTLNEQVVPFITKLKESEGVIKDFATIIRSFNGQGFITKLAQIRNEENKLTRIQDKLNNKFGVFGKLVGKFGVGSLVAGFYRLRLYYDLINKCVAKASEFRENMNLAVIAFEKDNYSGEYFDKMLKFQDNLHTKLMTNENELIRYQALYMEMLKATNGDIDISYGISEGLTKLSLDLASVFDYGMDQVSSDIKSMLAGQTKPGRKYGIDITETSLQQTAEEYGIDKQVSKMNYAEKQAMRYLTIVQQMGREKAIGDMSRTVNSLANQWRMLKNNMAEMAQWFGAMFVPLLEKVLPYLNAIFRVITDIFRVIATLFGYKALSNTSAGLIGSDDVDDVNDYASGLEDASNNAKKLKNNLLGIDELNIGGQEAGSGSEDGTAGGIDPSILNALGNVDLSEFEKSMEAVRNKAEELASSLEKVLGISKDADGNLSWSFWDMAWWAKLLLIILGEIAISKAWTKLKSIGDLILPGIKKALSKVVYELSFMKMLVQEEGVTSLLSYIWSKLSVILQKITAVLLIIASITAFKNVIKNWGDETYSICTKIRGAIGAIGLAVSAVVLLIGGWIPALGVLLVTAMASFWEYFAIFFAGVIQSVLYLVNIIVKAVGVIVATVVGVLESIIRIIESVVGTIIAIVEYVIAGISEMIRRLGDFVADAVIKIVSRINYIFQDWDLQKIILRIVKSILDNVTKWINEFMSNPLVKGAIEFLTGKTVKDFSINLDYSLLDKDKSYEQIYAENTAKWASMSGSDTWKANNYNLLDDANGIWKTLGEDWKSTWGDVTGTYDFFAKGGDWLNGQGQYIMDYWQNNLNEKKKSGDMTNKFMGLDTILSSFFGSKEEQKKEDEVLNEDLINEFMKNGEISEDILKKNKLANELNEKGIKLEDKELAEMARLQNEFGVGCDDIVKAINGIDMSKGNISQQVSSALSGSGFTSVTQLANEAGKTIADYKADYAKAQASGDWEGMKAANDAANSIRQSAGILAEVANVAIENVKNKTTKHASGGFPAVRGTFVYNEGNNAELLGNINGRTAVVNNEQIISSVSSGVANAVGDVLTRSGGFNNGGGGSQTLSATVKGKDLLFVVEQAEKARGRQTVSSSLARI